jgi:hypothetical protein
VGLDLAQLDRIRFSVDESVDNLLKFLAVHRSC